MYKLTKQQFINLVYARDEMWPNVRPEKVVPELSRWKCGTHACFGGFVALDRFFRQQGVRVMDAAGGPVMANGSTAVSQILFGVGGLFYRRGASDLDTDVTLTDHELVTHRLNWVIDNCEIID